LVSRFWFVEESLRFWVLFDIFEAFCFAFFCDFGGAMFLCKVTAQLIGGYKNIVL
jgi:hypothetical protein